MNAETGGAPGAGAVDADGSSPASVLIITPRWTRDGGVATHAMTSAEALAAAGLSVTAAAARIDESASVPGVALHHSPRLFDPNATPEQRLGGALNALPELIHLHQYEDPEALALMRAAAPVVISLHGYTACTSGVHYFRPGQECMREHGPGCVPNLLLRGCAHTRDPRWLPGAYRHAGRGREALRSADLVVCYSSAIDRHLAINGVERRRVVPLFTTMTPRSGSGHESRRRVVFAGRIIAPKGVAVLIRAARDLDAEVVICGDGSRLRAMRKLARRLSVESRVAFPGWLGVDELAHELAEASVVALPSVWPEPFGLVGIEANAAGRPVVASATGGVEDWLRPGVNGLAVPPGDTGALTAALSELLADPARQATMGAAGRELVEREFSRERHVAALREAYAIARVTWERR
ncbi:MAG TPA: glycosyltransferase family 4 protein [Solirubrobacteraceae bacterium]|nr:glycosyltransferase family 4 protein [Solirubrobacteraceae bacterium]